MNTNLRRKVKNNFVKDLLKLMNHAVFGRTSMENVWKHKNIKIVTTERRINYLISEPNYHTKKFFLENLLVIDMAKTQMLMNQPVYLGLSILDLCRTVMYEFWYDYIKPKYGENAKLWYMDTDRFIVHVRQMIFRKTLQKMLGKD